MITYQAFFLPKSPLFIKFWFDYILRGLLLIILLVNQLPAQIFYGMTSSGGADGLGAIIRFDASTNNLSAPYSMTNLTPGGSPLYTELREYNGKFYGMTFNGGADNMGVIFEWNPNTNVYTKKQDFPGLDGGNPMGSLTLHNGKFYGMTSQSQEGISNLGSIFEWDPTTNVYTKKVDFTGINGGHPSGNLTPFNDKLYGMTAYGGASGGGVIFEWDPSTNVYTKKMDFTGINGRSPSGSLTLHNGKLYGMTPEGGSRNVGVIFEWDPTTNVYIKKKDFTGSEDFIGSDGRSPNGNLTLANNKFYGMTLYGGSSHDDGVIFEWDPITNVYVKKIDFFYGEGGRRPLGSLTFAYGKFYGMTNKGGSNNVGVIFEWDPNTNVYNKKKDFNDTDGRNPQGSLTFANGKLYGMTSGGIFEWDPTTNVYTKKKDFNYTDGSLPQGSLTFVNGRVYGMTYRGGASGSGVIFEWDPTTNVYTKKKDFNLIDGHSPQGSLILYNGKFYGMTSGGGTSNAGVIFEWNPATNVYTKKKDFTGIDGRSPLGNLTLFNDKLYGMTLGGGASNYGVIFEWDPATNVYTKKKDFTGTDGANPYGSLTLVNGKFYGMTYDGGANNVGVIFEWNPATNAYTKKKDFNYPDGSYPSGNLTLYNGKFYGMTKQGGVSAVGGIFEWDPITNVYTKKKDFNYTDGNYPTGSLTLHNGKFYGMTRQGRINDVGVIFEWDLITNIYSNKADFTGANGANPSYSDLVLYEAADTTSVVTTRIEAETNFTKITDTDNDVIVTSGGGSIAASSWSNHLGVVLPDANADKIRINFNINTSGQYILKVRVRAGTTASPTLYWPDKYVFALNNASITLKGSPATLTAASQVFYGSFLGVMESSILNLNQGSYTLDVNATRTTGAVDYLELVRVISTTLRIEAENNFNVINDSDLDVASTSGGGSIALSNGLGVRLPDLGDKIRVNFTVNTARQYIIRAQVRSGTVTSPTLFWDSPVKYATTVDEIATVFNPILSSNTGPSSAFTGSYFGTMETIILNLSTGNHYASFQAVNRAWGVVDYIELVSALSLPTSFKNPELNIVKADEGNIISEVINVYPNPNTTGNFNLSLSNEIRGKVNVEVLDPLGVLVIRKTMNIVGSEINLDMSEIKLKNGIYFLKLSGANLESRTVKIVKN
jgi:uncharacterized repeat protein (TIGR03803 family)